METPAGRDPSNGNRMEKLIRLYREAGASVNAARAFRITLTNRASPGDLDRMAGIYLSSRRRDLALAPAARAAAATEGTAER